MLVAKNATMRFGGLTAVTDLNITVNDGEIVGLIGPNGAGKTTAFNMITGVYRPTEGSISYKGIDLAKVEPHKITELGLARTFQNIRLFREMSVLENVLVAGNLRMGVHFLRRRRSRTESCGDTRLSPRTRPCRRASSSTNLPRE